MNDPTGLWSAAVRARFALGDLVLDLHRGTLLDAQGAPLPLRPQVWAVLQHLARNAGRVVSREELFDAVWPGLVVTEGSVAQAISDVRAALGDTGHRIVKTVQRRGYMLLADAIAEDAEPDVDVPAADETAARASQASGVVASNEVRPGTADAEQTLRFGRIEVSPQQRRLRIDGADVSVGGRAFDLLVALIERRRRVVSRSELFDLVWPGRVVEDHNAAAQVLALRKLLGADAIATVPGRGYRFTLSSSDERELTRPAAASAAGRDRFTLPAPPALLGRDDDLAALQHLLAQHRHVTVLGAGGIGKTVLALAAAHARRGAQRDGVAWVDLSSLSQPALVAGAVAQALHLPVGRSEDPIPALVAGLESVEALLVLDNAEHVVDAVARLTDAIAAGAPDMRLLVTSQVALRAEREHLFRLGPLAVPQMGTPADKAIGFGAVALFVDQAQASDRRFVLGDDNVATVTELCRHLDGLPLAIKLAAGRLAFFGPRGLEQRLAERLKLLAGSSRSAPTRQQTLRAALDWSYSLASPGEQATFRRLGVFAGGSGFSLELAKAVAGDNGEDDDEWTVIEHVSALVDRSLVAADSADPPRYRLLESAREYALLKLEEAGELPATQHRLARAMQAVFERYSVQVQTAPDAVLLATYGCEIDNLRAALDWSARHDALLAVDLLGRSGGFHILAGLQHEQRRRSESIEPAVGDVPAGVAARYWLSRAGSSVPSRPIMSGCARKAIALYRSIGDRRQLYLAHLYLAWSWQYDEWEAAQAELDQIEQSGCPAFLRAWRRHAIAAVHHKAGRLVEARAAAEAALVLARSVDSRRAAAVTENELASIEMSLGEVDQGVSRMRAVIDQERKVLGGVLELSYGTLARGLILQGNLEEARKALAELFRQCRLTEGERFPVFAHWCAGLAISERRYEAAARLMGFASAERRHHGREDVVEPGYDAVRSSLAARLDAATLERLMAEGAALDREAAFALTLECRAACQMLSRDEAPSTLRSQRMASLAFDRARPAVGGGRQNRRPVARRAVGSP